MLRRLIDSPWLYFGLAVLLVGAAVVARLDVRLHPRPNGSIEDLASLRERDDVNLLFILIDTLRADRLSSYGYERETSPVIDALAAGGVRFAHVQSQSSWTKCSMASLWTGLYPVSNGVLRFPDALSPDALLPAEILRMAGFRTAGIFRNGWVAANFGFDQGFELYLQPGPGRRPAGMEQNNPSALRLAGSDLDITESAIEFLRGSRRERWFLYLHYMDVHQYVYDTESARFGTSYSDIYDNSIHWADRNVGAILSALQEHRLLDKTLIVLASDHGEAFYEHGLEGHARNVYAEVTETPLILSFPFRLDPGIVVDAQVANVDLWPTVLDLLGVPPLPEAHGLSLVPSIEAAGRGAPPPEAERRTFAQLDRTWARRNAVPDSMVAVSEGAYRLIHRERAPDHDELYDRSIDPVEQNDIAREYPERAATLRQHAETYLKRSPAPWGAAPTVDIDDLKLGQLRALGYLPEKK